MVATGLRSTRIVGLVGRRGRPSSGRGRARRGLVSKPMAGGFEVRALRGGLPTTLASGSRSSTPEHRSPWNGVSRAGRDPPARLERVRPGECAAQSDRCRKRSSGPDGRCADRVVVPGEGGLLFRPLGEPTATVSASTTARRVGGRAPRRSLSARSLANSMSATRWRSPAVSVQADGVALRWSWEVVTRTVPVVLDGEVVGYRPRRRRPVVTTITDAAPRWSCVGKARSSTGYRFRTVALPFVRPRRPRGAAGRRRASGAPPTRNSKMLSRRGSPRAGSGPALPERRSTSRRRVHRAVLPLDRGAARRLGPRCAPVALRIEGGRLPQAPPKTVSVGCLCAKSRARRPSHHTSEGRWRCGLPGSRGSGRRGGDGRGGVSDSRRGGDPPYGSGSMGAAHRARRWVGPRVAVDARPLPKSDPVALPWPWRGSRRNSADPEGTRRGRRAAGWTRSGRRARGEGGLGSLSGDRWSCQPTHRSPSVAPAAVSSVSP